MAKRKKYNPRFFLGFLTGVLAGMLGLILTGYVLDQYFANLF